MNNLSKFFLLISLTILPFFAQEILACSCGVMPTPYDAFKEAKAVFVGKITHAKRINEDYHPEMQQLRFAVQESFKGINNVEVDIKTGYVNGSCIKALFFVGRSYLVYAYEQDTKGNLVTGICTRTTNIEAAQGEIFYIRALLENKPEPRIYGAVDLLNTDLAEYSYSYVEGIKIVVEGENDRFVTFTDKNGVYSFYNIPDGKYKVRPELPAKYTSHWRDEEKIILDSQNKTPPSRFSDQSGSRSAYLNFSIEWNNEISGKVFDAEGKPLKLAIIRLLPLVRANDTLIEQSSYSVHKPLEEGGKYKIYGYTPGRYVLAVEVHAPFISGMQNRRTYHPQTTDSEKAEIIELGESDKKNIDIKLNSGLIVRDIEGEVFWSDGTPVKEGGVSLNKLKDEDHKTNIIFDSESIEEGKFKIQAFENAQYWIQAGTIINGEFLNARPLKITVGKTNAPLKIIIPLPKGLVAPK